MRVLLVVRIRETPNPEMTLDSPLSGFFPKALISATRPPMMDGPQSFRDFAISNDEMSRHLVPLIPKVLNSEMSTAFDLRHVSRPMDGSDCFGVFILEIPDLLSSGLPIS
jgi:hypothetical protein